MFWFVFFSGKNSQENLFLTRRVGKNIVCYSALKKKCMGLFWKMLPQLQALDREPELCQCGFAGHMTVKICPSLSFKCHELTFSRKF